VFYSLLYGFIQRIPLRVYYITKFAVKKPYKNYPMTNNTFIMVLTYHLNLKIRGEKTMNTTNKTAVPQAKEAMNQFKYEVASEIGVPLKQGYNGDLTSAQAGYVGGYMVNSVSPERRKSFLRRVGMRNIGSIEVGYSYIVVFG